MNALNDGTQADFVYMGRRLGTKDVVAVLGVVQPDGTLKEKMCFRQAARKVGNIRRAAGDVGASRANRTTRKQMRKKTRNLA